MSEPYDGVILGAGHNAQVLQAYLARAGLRVLSLDWAAVAGAEGKKASGVFYAP
jgi:phytoene dehydrogenase-like protein